MKNRLSDSSGYKTYAAESNGVVTVTTIRRLPMRPGDNDSRYRVRLVRHTLAGVVLSNTYRDMDISKAYRVFEQNKARLAA